MPRTISVSGMRSALAQNTDEVWLTLLAISPAPGSTPQFSTVYLVDNTETVVHNGHSYEPFPFSISLPSDEPEQDPAATISFSNISRALIEELRSVSAGPLVEIRGLRASATSTLEYGPVNMKSLGITYNANTVEMNLGFDSFVAEPVPWISFSPQFFPGMFT